jgi:hypothetical protein
MVNLARNKVVKPAYFSKIVKKNHINRKKKIGKNFSHCFEKNTN